MDIYYSVIETPLGWMLLVGKDGKVVETNLPKSSRDEAEAAAPPGAEESAGEFGELAHRLRLYFDGERVDFSDIPVIFEGLGEFEERVLLETMKVPYGAVTTYGALATASGSPGAARAIGNAMRRNPLPIIVPCHRVLHSDGGIGGYSGGIDLKHRLLGLEGVIL